MLFLYHSVCKKYITKQATTKLIPVVLTYVRTYVLLETHHCIVRARNSVVVLDRYIQKSVAVAVLRCHNASSKKTQHSII